MCAKKILSAEVGRIPGDTVLSALDRLDTSGVDQVVLSACLQISSMGVLAEASRRSGRPVTSAARCTAKQLLRRLGLSVASEASGTKRRAEAA